MNIKAIALAAVVGLSTITAAEARPTHVVCDHSNKGTEFCFRPIGRTGVTITVVNKYDRTGYIAVGDCATGQYRWRSNVGFTRNQIGHFFREVCNY